MGKVSNLRCRSLVSFARGINSRITSIVIAGFMEGYKEITFLFIYSKVIHLTGEFLSAENEKYLVESPLHYHIPGYIIL